MREDELGARLRVALVLDGTTRERLTADFAERRRQEALWQSYSRIMHQSGHCLRNILAHTDAAVFQAVCRYV